MMRQKVNRIIELFKGDDREYLALLVLFSSDIQMRELVSLRYSYLFKPTRKWRRVFYHPQSDRVFKISIKKRAMIQRYCDYYEIEGDEWIFFDKKNPDKHVTAHALREAIKEKLRNTEYERVTKSFIRTIERKPRR